MRPAVKDFAAALARIALSRGMALTGPWTLALKRHIAEQTAEEEANVRLRAIAGDRYDHYGFVVAALERWSAERSPFDGTHALSRREAVEAVATILAFGVDPTRDNVHEYYQLMQWGML
jgi:hypothetical protein